MAGKNTASNKQTVVNPPPVDRKTGLSQSEVEALHKLYGYNETEEKKTPPWKIYLKKYWNLSAWMLESVVILSLFLQKYSDAIVVGCVLFINSTVVFIQDYRASDAVELLKKKLNILVNTLRDSRWQVLPSRELVPGDIIRLRTGDFVPADLQLIEGNITVNQSSLTGESEGIRKREGDNIYSGSTIIEGETTASVTTTGKYTFYGKTIELLRSASPQSIVDNVIGKVLKWLSAVIGSMLLLAIIVSLMKGISLLSILPLMIILFMNAIPVALTVMFSVSNAVGAKQLLKEGVLVTRMNAPNDAAGMDILCIDKTGTLTINKITITGLFPSEGFTDHDILLFGTLASQEADHSAIDIAFIEAFGKQQMDTSSYTQKSFTPFSPQNRRTEALIQSGNNSYTVYKGAFDVITGLIKMDDTAHSTWEKTVNDVALKGYRAIAVAVAYPDKPVQFVGIAALHDPPREDAGKVIADLKRMGVSVKLLTGDALPIAREIAEKTGIGNAIIKASELNKEGDINSQLEKYNGVAEVYPEDKYKIVKALQAAGHTVGMTGDGVNDAPALKQVEVGIAVNEAADVAKSSASIILTQEGLGGILSPIRIGRVMFERFKIWLLNKLSRTLLKVSFIVLALIIFGKYVVSTTVMLLLLLITDFVIISISNNKVKISPEPDKWNIPKLSVTGVVLGVLMTFESLILLYIGWHFFGLDSNEGQLYTFCYLILLFFSLISTFVVREENYFWKSKPGTTDTIILLINFVVGWVISLTGFLELKPLPIHYTLLITAYITLLSFTINDIIKVAIYKKSH